MKTRIYTKEELEILKQNIFVLDVKYKREIVYDPIFKLWTIMMRLEHPELTAREIFKLGGFDVTILHSKLPQRRIREWLTNYQKFGVAYFLPVNTPYYSIKKLTKDKEIQVDSMKEQLLEFILGKLNEKEGR